MTFVVLNWLQADYRLYSIISRTFLPGIWPVFCLRLIRATFPEGQSFLSAIALTEQKMTFSGQMFATMRWFIVSCDSANNQKHHKSHRMQ